MDKNHGRNPRQAVHSKLLKLVFVTISHLHFDFKIWIHILDKRKRGKKTSRDGLKWEEKLLSKFYTILEMDLEEVDWS